MDGKKTRGVVQPRCIWRGRRGEKEYGELGVKGNGWGGRG